MMSTILGDAFDKQIEIVVKQATDRNESLASASQQLVSEWDALIRSIAELYQRLDRAKRESVQSAAEGKSVSEAKRCVNSRANRWQRARVEFEFRSRNFRDHGHDATKCDLIVCWQHDWPDCPLEVIELRTVIERLDG
jgi:hypothetical protein